MADDRTRPVVRRVRWSMIKLTRHRGMWSLVLVLAGVQLARAGGAGNDLLPDIPVGAVAVRLELVANAGTLITKLASALDGSGRMFIVSPNGVIRILRDGVIEPVAFLNDPATPPDGGMVSIAFHPEFATNGRLFVWTGAASGSGGAPDYAPPQDDTATAFDNLLVEYVVDPPDADVIDTGTKRELLRVHQANRQHNADDLVFGNDGLLYISIGDGGETRTGVPIPFQDNAQNLDLIQGGVARIDVDATTYNGRYAIPASNPFAQGGGAPERFAWGLRNPWRISVDRLTGEIHVGSNGDFTVEAIYQIENGANYGWPLIEGSFLWDPVSGNAAVDPAPDPSLTRPRAEWDHNATSEAWGSVIGGFVYRGSAISALSGKYLAFDFVAGQVVAMDTQSGALERLRLDIRGHPLEAFDDVTWSEDENGEPYIAGLDGDVSRLIPVCAGDTNLDGTVTFDDVELVLAQWLADYGAATGPGDANGDGLVNFDDINTALANWLAVCP